jgi:hypothetical protein
MPRYFFDLIDTSSVTDVNVAILDDDEQARTLARDLAAEVRQARPELIGQGYEVLIRNERRDEIARVSIDPHAQDGKGM